jgi:hypothetical protein
MSSEVETSRNKTVGIPKRFFDSAKFILSERSESNGLHSE